MAADFERSGVEFAQQSIPLDCTTARGTKTSSTCSVQRLVGALDATFGTLEGCPDRWTLDMLDDEIRPTFGDEEWVHTRGSVIQRVIAQHVYHTAELNEALGIAELPQVDLRR